VTLADEGTSIKLKDFHSLSARFSMLDQSGAASLWHEKKLRLKPELQP
jgi:hypothetical protein